MKNLEDQLKELVNNLKGFPRGQKHLRYCRKCRTLNRHFKGLLELNEAFLKHMEAHLEAQIALRKAKPLF